MNRTDAFSLQICIVDLFGKLAEEKEVSKIVNKTEEAKGNKSYNMLNIVAEYASPSHMLDLVHPFNEVKYSVGCAFIVLMGHVFCPALHWYYCNVDGLKVPGSYMSQQVIYQPF